MRKSFPQNLHVNMESTGAILPMSYLGVEVDEDMEYEEFVDLLARAQFWPVKTSTSPDCEK